MKFKKYPSIENSYREKHIHWWTNQYPELEEERYIIVEKVHGANFQLIISENEVKFASRNRVLEKDMEFYNYLNVMKKYSKLIDELQKIAIDRGVKTMRVYGELFGANIQKGVDYGDEVRFRIFDIYFDDRLLSQRESIGLLVSAELVEYFVPIMGFASGLEEATSFNENFNTSLSKLIDNNAEGVVIKPYERVYENKQGSVFYLKKKSESFLQRQKKPREQRADSNEMTKMWDIYSEYLNENRVQGVFSKHGEIKEPNEIGKYIKLVLEDAKEDFLKDNTSEYNELSKKDRRRVLSITGKYIAPILKKYL